MPVTLPVLPALRRVLTVLLVAMVACPAGLTLATAPASAQLLNNSGPQTKEEAEQARDAAEDARDDGGSLPLGAWLVIGAAVLIGAATVYILRDARSAAGPEDPRRAPKGPAVDASRTRGVSGKALFEGEGSASNPHGRTKKRQQGKRQKQARRANRPKR